MFRRRRPLRPIVRPVVRSVVRPVVVPGARRAMMTPNVPPALRRANELMAAGKYDEAADIFEQFARGAMVRNGPRAPQFFLQAGRCRILVGQVPAGMALLKQGLSLITEHGNTQQLQNAGQRIVAELKQRNLTAEAAEIEAILSQAIPGGFTPGAAAGQASTQPHRLPTRCPSCGGTLIADEAEWLDDATAECPYCGSGVRSE